MKKISRLVYPAVVAGLLCASTHLGRAQETGFYLKADLGGNVTEDVKVEEFFGVNVSGVKLELDPGIRGGVGAGYQFVDWFAAEAELGFMINEIKSVKGGGYVHDSTLSSVPFLVNAKFQLPLKRCPVTPYAGVGVGFSEQIFDVDELAIGNTIMYGSDAAAVFAWQAFAGLRFAINERMGLGVEYRYFEADSASWDAEVFHTASNAFELGRARTHAVSLAFDFHF